MAKNYKRREFLKLGAKAAAGSVVYGALGRLTGTAYEKARDMYRKTIGYAGNKLAELDRSVEQSKNPVVEYTVKPVKRLEEKRAGIYRRIFGIKERDTLAWQKSHGVEPSPLEEEVSAQTPERQDGDDEIGTYSRRGFLSRIIGYADEHPAGVGTAVGAGYGGAKYGVKGSYTLAKRAAMEKLKTKVASLEGEVKELKKSKINDERPTNTELVLILGLAGLVGSSLLGVFQITTYAALKTQPEPMISSISIIIFIISSLAIFTIYLIRNFLSKK